MEPAPYPTHDQIRKALVERAAEFVRLTECPKSSIGKNSVNDPAFISRIEGGSNFTVEIYQKVQSWLDANWPKDADQRKAS